MGLIDAGQDLASAGEAAVPAIDLGKLLERHVGGTRGVLLRTLGELPVELVAYAARQPGVERIELDVQATPAPGPLDAARGRGCDVCLRAYGEPTREALAHLLGGGQTVAGRQAPLGASVFERGLVDALAFAQALEVASRGQRVRVERISAPGQPVQASLTRASDAATAARALLEVKVIDAPGLTPQAQSDVTEQLHAVLAGFALPVRINGVEVVRPHAPGAGDLPSSAGGVRLPEGPLGDPPESPCVYVDGVALTRSLARHIGAVVVHADTSRAELALAHPQRSQFAHPERARQVIAAGVREARCERLRRTFAEVADAWNLHEMLRRWAREIEATHMRGELLEAMAWLPAELMMRAAAPPRLGEPLVRWLQPPHAHLSRQSVERGRAVVARMPHRPPETDAAMAYGAWCWLVGAWLPLDGALSAGHWASELSAAEPAAMALVRVEAPAGEAGVRQLERTSGARGALVLRVHEPGPTRRVELPGVLDALRYVLCDAVTIEHARVAATSRTQAVMHDEVLYVPAQCDAHAVLVALRSPHANGTLRAASVELEALQSFEQSLADARSGAMPAQ